MRLNFEEFDPMVSVISNERSRGIILFLYGGSPTFTVDSLNLMRILFHFAGYGSAAFTHRFMDPWMHKGGLHTRIEDARSALDKVRTRYPALPVILCGISMGGYVATHLLRQNPDGMVLIAPGAYDASIVPDRVCFDTEFTERIHETYMRSDGFENLAQFSGPLLIARFRNDDVVKEIPQVYYNRARSRNKRLHEFRGDHLLFRGNGDPSDRADRQLRQRCVAEYIITWLDEVFMAHS